jgi:hypothetical protein
MNAKSRRAIFLVALLATCTSREDVSDQMSAVVHEVFLYAAANRMTVPAALSDIPALRTNRWAMENVDLVFTGRLSAASNASTQILLRTRIGGLDKVALVAFVDGHVELMMHNPKQMTRRGDE